MKENTLLCLFNEHYYVKKVINAQTCGIVLLIFGLIASAAKADVYDRPYSFTENDVDTTLLKHNTTLLVGGSIVIMGLLYLAPSSSQTGTTNPAARSASGGKMFLITP